MSISIIVPVYNTEKYLSACLDSILTQSFTDFELLLVDDGSTDNSGEICDEYAQKDARVRVFHKENGGVSSARNLGLEHAHGEYVHFVDADDVVLEGAYDYISKRCLDTAPDVVCFNSMCDATKNTHIQEGEETYYESFSQYLKKQGAVVPVWKKLFKRSFVNENGLTFEDLSYSEDTVFVWNALRCRGGLLSSTAVLYSYTTNPNSVVNSRDVISVKKSVNSFIGVNTRLKALFHYFNDTPNAINNFTHKYKLMFNRVLCTPYSYKEIKEIFSQCAEIGIEHLEKSNEVKWFDKIYHHPTIYYFTQPYVLGKYFGTHAIKSNTGDFINGRLTDGKLFQKSLVFVSLVFRTIFIAKHFSIRVYNFIAHK